MVSRIGLEYRQTRIYDHIKFLYVNLGVHSKYRKKVPEKLETGVYFRWLNLYFSGGTQLSTKKVASSFRWKHSIMFLPAFISPTHAIFNFFPSTFSINSLILRSFIAIPTMNFVRSLSSQTTTSNRKDSTPNKIGEPTILK